MTQEELDKLAVFAGLEKYYYLAVLAWRDSDGFYCYRQDWRPDKNPIHGDLVLRAIVIRKGWWWIRRKIGESFVYQDYHGPDWFWPFVCRMAEVITAKGENE